VKHAGFLIAALFLVACASEPRPTVAGPARYANPDEAARLHSQAAANFQRERERQGMIADRRSAQPAQPVTLQASALPPVMEGPPPRRRVSAAEAHYAMQIGKSPYELTPGERAIAVGY
jgi:hypothetical protein